MPSVQIQGGEYPLGGIFSDAFEFEIPRYQRPYSWGKDQTIELLDDLVASLQPATTALADLEPYFLGNVVLIKEKEGAHAEVVDGQQRLTTLTILFAAIRERLPDGAEQIDDFLRQKANKFAGTKAKYRLVLREKDADFFRTYVQAAEGLDELAALKPASLSDPRRNIRDNALLLRSALADMDAEDVDRLATFLVQATYLVVVSTPSLTSAYRIFSVLNARGLDLTAADLFKADVLGQIDEDLQDKYTGIWDDLEDRLGRDRFSDLFSHIRMIFTRTKQRGTVLKEFETSVFTKVAPGRAFVEQILVPYGNAYEAIVEWETNPADLPTEAKALLGWLSRIDNFDWIPPAVLWLSEHPGDDQGVVSFLTDLERLAASMFLRRVDLTRRIERYGRLLAEIADGEDFGAPTSSMQLTNDEISETLSAVEGPVYESLRRPLRYLLLRLDAYLSSGGVTHEFPTVSVEHVLPQGPAADSAWAQDFTTEQQEAWVHRMANLVLLTRRKNSQASNYDFDKKKHLYFMGSHGTTTFALTSQVLAQPSWTPNVLEARQQTLVGTLINLWRLEPSTTDS